MEKKTKFSEIIYHLPSRVLGVFNLPSSRVKRSKLSKEYLEKKYTIDEEKGLDWFDQIFDAFFSGDKDQYIELSKQSKKVHFANLFADMLINRYTKKHRGEDFDIILGLLENFKETGKFIQDISINENELVIQTALGPICAKKLSKYIPEILEIFPAIEGDNRSGNCHKYAVNFINHFNIPCKVCTGYIAPLGDKAKVLHSWIEYKNQNNKWNVIDLTKNAVYNRNGYYLLNDITGPVYKISDKTIKKDYKLLIEMTEFEPYLSKLYLSNRRQAKYAYKQLLAQTKQTEI